MSSKIIFLFPGFVAGFESQQLLIEYVKLYAVWLFMWLWLTALIVVAIVDGLYEMVAAT